MKFKGILFDLDGVLVHTDKLHYRAWKKIADECGILFNEEINNLLRGVSRMEALKLFKKLPWTGTFPEREGSTGRRKK